MKNLKFLLPMLAFIFAIGMSFANVEKVNDPTTDYYLDNGNFVPIGMELTCGSGNIICKVQLEQNGPERDVYNDADPKTLKRGNGTVIRLWQQ